MASVVPFVVAITIHDIPEGLAVSVAARNAGMGTYTCAAITGIRAGVVAIPLRVFGAIPVGVATPLLPHAMGFAGGGMLFVISYEIVPQTHARGKVHVATIGMMIGVVVMLYLDVALA